MFLCKTNIQIRRKLARGGKINSCCSTRALHKARGKAAVVRAIKGPEVELGHPAVELLQQHVLETALLEQVGAGDIRMVKVQLNFAIGAVHGPDLPNGVLRSYSTLGGESSAIRLYFLRNTSAHPNISADSAGRVATVSK